MSKIADVLKRIEIINILENLYNIHNYIINDDFSIDIDGDMCFSRYIIMGNKIPNSLKFRKVKGMFGIENCDIETLENFPYCVEGDIMIINCGNLRNISDICTAIDKNQKLFIDKELATDINISILGYKGYKKLFLYVGEIGGRIRCDEYNIVRKDNAFVKERIRYE